MRIRGFKGTKALFLLIDSGSTHNFLDSKMAKRMCCILEPIPALRSQQKMVMNWFEMKFVKPSNGKCKGINSRLIF